MGRALLVCHTHACAHRRLSPSASAEALRSQVKQNNQLMRARRLRANAHFLSSGAFAARKHFFVSKESGVLCEKIEPPNAMAMMQDPSVMMNMMQGNFAMMVPQMLMMGIVNYFFSGFVLGKIPFPLTPSFKGMLQRGIALSSLDTAYVTSMSWCAFSFGLRMHPVAAGDSLRACMPRCTQTMQQCLSGSVC